MHTQAQHITFRSLLSSMFSLFDNIPTPLPFDYDLTSTNNDTNIAVKRVTPDVHTCNFPFHLELTAPPLAQAISTYPSPEIKTIMTGAESNIPIPTPSETKATLAMVYRNVSCALRWNIHPVGKARYGKSSLLPQNLFIYFFF